MTELQSFFIILIGLSMLYISFTGRLEAYIKTMAAQGALLFFLIFFDIGKIPLINFIFLITETLIFKTVLIPLFLMRIIRKNEIYREVEPYIPNYYSILISAIILVFGFSLTYWASGFAVMIKPLYFGISISVMMNGLFIVLSRKKIITHILGYIFLENGIFLFSLSIASEMPLIVNMGVLLDIFVGVFLFGMFANKIMSTFDELDIDKLSRLKD
jgi:hydrogenase-4 component E